MNAQATAYASTACYFGTFNPIHLGHLRIAQTVLNQTLVERVLFIPSPAPPNRLADHSLVAYEYRWAMVERACGDHPQFWACDIERYMEQPSYTAQTLQALSQKGILPQNQRIPLVIGADSWTTLPTWYQTEWLSKHVFWLVAPRSQQPLADIGPDYLYQRLTMPDIDVSASQIRQALAQGQNVSYWVHPATANIIGWNHLYR